MSPSRPVLLPINSYGSYVYSRLYIYATTKGADRDQKCKVGPI